MRISPDEADLIVSVYRESAQIFCEPPVYWKDFHGYQAWATAKHLFVIERGIQCTADDGSDAGRKAFSRMRLSLEARGLIYLTILSRTTRSVCLTAKGLAAAEELTGEKAPESLLAAIKAIEAEEAQHGDSATDSGRNRVLDILARLDQQTEEGE